MIEKAICLNIEQLIRNASKPLRLKDIPMHYAQVYRHALRPEDLGVANIEELILNMNDKFHVKFFDKKKNNNNFFVFCHLFLVSLR